MEIEKNSVRLATIQTAAAMTDLSVWTWRAWAYSGKVASVKMGTRLMIPVAEIDRVIVEGTRPRRQAITA